MIPAGPQAPPKSIAVYTTTVLYSANPDKTPVQDGTLVLKQLVICLHAITSIFRGEVDILPRFLKPGSHALTSKSLPEGLTNLTPSMAALFQKSSLNTLQSMDTITLYITGVSRSKTIFGVAILPGFSTGLFIRRHDFPVFSDDGLRFAFGRHFPMIK